MKTKPAQNSIENHLNITAAARTIGVSSSSLRNFEKQGRITSVRADNGYRVFRIEDVLKLKDELSQERIEKKTHKKIQKDPQSNQSTNQKAETLNQYFEEIKPEQIITTSDSTKHSPTLAEISEFLKEERKARTANSLLANPNQKRFFKKSLVSVSTLALLWIVSMMINGDDYLQLGNTAATYNEISRDVQGLATNIGLSKLNTTSSDSQRKAKSSGQEKITAKGFVLAAEDRVRDLVLTFNVPVIFTKPTVVESTLTVNELSSLIGGIETQNAAINAGTGTITAGIINMTGSAQLNSVRAINDITETTFEAALDINGDVVGTGLNSVKIKTGIITGDHLSSSVEYDGDWNFTNTFSIDGSEVTATADELNMLSGTTVTTGGVMFGNGSNIAQNPTRFYWNDTSYRLGLNTSSPTATLDVNGTANVSGNLSVGDITSINGVTYTWPTTQASSTRVLFNDGSGTLSWGTLGAANITPDSLDWSEFTDTMTLDDTTTIDMDTNSADFNFDNGTLYIDNTGYIGIGTTAPTQALHVSGNARITGALYDSSNSAGTSGYILTSTGTGTSWASVSSTLDSSYYKQNGNSFGGLATLGTNDNYALAFETNGTERVRVNTSGNVGIGTTNPIGKLDIEHDDSTEDYGIRTNTTFSGLNFTEATVQINNISGSSSTLGTVYSAYNNFNISGTPSIRADHYGTYNVFNSTGTKNSFVGTRNWSNGQDFTGLSNYSVSDEASTSYGVYSDLYGANDGNVQTLYGEYISMTSYNAADRGYGVYILDGVSGLGTQYGVYIDLNNVGSTKYGIFETGGAINYFAGNVGIGTTNPTQALHVSGSARITGALYDSSNSAGTSGYILTSTGTGTSWASVSSTLDSSYYKQNGNSFGGLATIGTNDNNSLAFETNGTEYMRLSTSGNVGIGTTNPNHKLDINPGSTYGLNIDSVNPTSQRGINITTSTNTTSSGTYSIYNSVTAGTASAPGMAYGSYMDISVNSGAYVGTSAQGYGNYIQGINAADVGNLWANYTQIAGTEDSRTQTLYGNYVQLAPKAGGTDRAYGVYVTDYGFGAYATTGGNLYAYYASLASSATNSWGLYITGEDNNYLSNNLGIGNTAPTYKLDVTGTGRFTGDLRVTGAYYDSSASAGTSGYILTSTGTGTAWSSVSSTLDSSYYKQNGNSFGGLATIGTNDNNSLAFETNGTERMRLNTSGYLGIGTTNPQKHIDIDMGELFATTEGIRLHTLGGTGSSEYYASIGFGEDVASTDYVGSMEFKITNVAGPVVYKFAGEDTARDIFFADGTVGIGVTIPSATLEIKRYSATAGMRIDAGSGTNSYIDFYENGSMGANIWWSGANNYLGINGQNTNTIINLNGGDVGIGTSSPQSDLHISDSSGVADLTLQGTGDAWTYSDIKLLSDEATDKEWQINHRRAAPNENNLMFWFYNGSSWISPFYIDETGYTVMEGDIGGSPTDWQGQAFIRTTDDTHIARLGFLGEDSNWAQIEAGPGTASTRGYMAFRVRNGDSTMLEAARFNQNGYLGIGTTNPQYALDVLGTGRFTGDMRVTGAYYDSSASAGTSGYILTSTGTGTSWASVSATLDTSYYKQDGNTFGGLATIGTNDNNSLAFETNGTEYMRLNTSGLFGIGTTNPLFALHTVGVGYFSTGIQTGDGIAAAPSITFGSNPSTGLYRPASNQLGISTNGTERIRVDSSGNVGIGTTSPSYVLDIWNTSSNIFRLMNSGGTSTYLTAGASGMNSYVDIETRTGGGLINTHLESDGTNDSYLNSQGGSIGIGTTSPASKLHVAGGDVTTDSGYGYVISSYNTYLKYNYLRLYSAGQITGDANGNLSFSHNSGTTTNVYFKNDGTVGIGTTAPLGKLNVAGGNVYIGTPSTGDANPQLHFYSTTTDSVIQNTGGHLSLGHSSAIPEALVIMPTTGYVGIGTTAPSSQLQVNASSVQLRLAHETDPATDYSTFTVDASGYLSIKSSGGYNYLNNTAANNYLFAYDGSNNRYSYMSGTGMAVTNSGSTITYFPYTGNSYITSGNVGIGTTNPAARLQVSGGDILVDNNRYLQFLDSGGTARNILGFTSGDNVTLAGVSATSDIYIGESSSIVSKSGGRVIIGSATSNVGNKFSVSGNAAIGSTYKDVTAPTNGMIIEGNLGIGNTNPTNTLTLAPTGGYQNDWNTTSGYIRSSGLSTRRITDYDNTSYFLDPEASSTALAVAGSIGVGTTSPSGKIHVYGTGANGNNILLETTGTGYAGANFVAKSATDSRGRGLYMPTTGAEASSSWFAGVPYGGGGFQIGNASDHAVTEGGNTSGPYMKASAKLFINTSGSVGIGTTSPEATLDISSGYLSLMLGADSNATTRTTNTAKYSRVMMPHYDNTEEPVGIMFGFTDGSSNILNFGGGTGFNNSATLIRFYTASAINTTTGTERLRIDGSGNVGIGTTNPGYKLDVAGNFRVYANGTTLTTYIGTTGTPAQYGSLDDIYFDLDRDQNAASNSFLWRNDGSTEIMRLTSAGSLGIGTTAPSDKLTIDSGNIGMSVNYKLQWDSGSAEYIYRPTGSDAIIIGTNGSDRLYVNSSGDTGIGEAAPGSKLSVNGGLSVGTTTAYTRTAAPTGGAIISGTVGIGTSSPTGKLNIVATTEQLRLGYDASNYTSFTVNSSGNVTVANSGTTMTVDDVLKATNNIHLSSDYSLILNDGTDNSYLKYVSGSTRIGVWTTGTEVARFNSDGSVDVNGNVNANAFDIAEMYPTFDSDIEAGMIVSLAKSSENSKLSYSVVKAKGSADANVMGVVSSRPGITFGGGSFRDEFCSVVESKGLDKAIEYDVKRIKKQKSIGEDEPYEMSNEELEAVKDKAKTCLAEKEVPVALAGRVPVLIDTDSSEIEVGDLLTVSNDSRGKAVKSTNNTDVIIGRALENWSNDSDKDTVMAVVGINWSGKQASVVQSSTVIDSYATVAQLNTVESDISTIKEALGLTKESTDSNQDTPFAEVLAQVDTKIAELKEFTEALGITKTGGDNETVLEIAGDLNVGENVSAKSLAVSKDILLGTLKLNAVEGSIDTLGGSCIDNGNESDACSENELYIQKTLAGNVNIFDGKIVLTPSGRIQIEGELVAKQVTTEKINIKDSTEKPAAGKVTIKEGDKTVKVQTEALTDDSLIIVTPEKPVIVGAKATDDKEFEIKLDEEASEDIEINWIIIN